MDVFQRNNNYKGIGFYGKNHTRIKLIKFKPNNKKHSIKPNQISIVNTRLKNG